jgi:hypothetical protein
LPGIRNKCSIAFNHSPLENRQHNGANFTTIIDFWESDVFPTKGINAPLLEVQKKAHHPLVTATRLSLPRLNARHINCTASMGATSG